MCENLLGKIAMSVLTSWICGAQSILDCVTAAFSFSGVNRGDMEADEATQAPLQFESVTLAKDCDGGKKALLPSGNNVKGITALDGDDRLSVFKSRGAGAPVEVFSDEINGGIRKGGDSSGTDSDMDTQEEVCFLPPATQQPEGSLLANKRSPSS